MAALAGSGGVAILDTQTVTRGMQTVGTDPFYSNYSGYSAASPAIGSISDSTSNVYSGATISMLYFWEYSESFQYLTRQLVWRVGSVVSNSGWTTMLVGTSSYNRADAAFTTGGAYSQWVWSLPIPDNFVSEGDPFTASTTVKWY